MDVGASERLFRLLDRAFWLIWLGFPVLIWLLADEARSGAERFSQLPEQAACLDLLPQVDRFSATGKAVFWSVFALEYAVYALLMFFAHRVIHRCAQGRVLVAEMIGTLSAIGGIIAAWPIAQLILANLSALVLERLGDAPSFAPGFALDLPVMGVGLLVLTMAAAMRQAVNLRREADLTI